MTYRGETDPLKTEESALAAELAQLQRREREVARSLDQTRAKLRNERTLPLLEDVKIASPCSASWDDMIGDARVRFCGKCAKNVYNLSEMTREEGEALLAATEKEMCVRLYKRADGTVITTDCPVGVKAKRVRRVATLALAALGAGAAAIAATEQHPVMGGCPRTFQPVEAQMGDVARPPSAEDQPKPPEHVQVLSGTTPPMAPPPLQGRRSGGRPLK